MKYSATERIQQLANAGYTFIKWDTVYKDGQSKAHMTCSKGHTRISRLNNVINMKQQCPYCLKKIHTEYDRIQQLRDLGWKFIEWKTPYKNPSTVVTVGCQHNHQFSATLDSLVYTKSGCPKCSKCYRYTPEEYIERVNSLGWEFISWVDETRNISSRIVVKCKNEHVTTRLLDDVVNAESGCNTCATLNRVGFLHQRNTDDPLYYEPTTLYCLHFKSKTNTEEFWKVGVTSKPKARVPKDAPEYDISIVETFHTTYNIAFEIEQQAKALLQHHYPTYTFGGYTECYVSNPINFVKDKLIIQENKHLL